MSIVRPQEKGENGVRKKTEIAVGLAAPGKRFSCRLLFSPAAVVIDSMLIRQIAVLHTNPMKGGLDSQQDGCPEMRTPHILWTSDVTQSFSKGIAIVKISLSACCNLKLALEIPA
jgi:hypothetical protein